MHVKTTRFGQLETVDVSDGALLTFPEGLPGFEQRTRFALVEDEKLAPFHYLQCLDDPNLGFLVLEPETFAPDYAFDLGDTEVALLGLAAGGVVEPRVLSILVVPGDVNKMTANLRAPVVINPSRRLAKQVILAEDRYPIRHPVFGEARTPAAAQNGTGH